MTLGCSEGAARLPNSLQQLAGTDAQGTRESNDGCYAWLALRALEEGDLRSMESGGLSECFLRKGLCDPRGSQIQRELLDRLHTSMLGTCRQSVYRQIVSPLPMSRRLRETSASWEGSDDELLTAKQAAVLLTVNDQTLRRWASEGRIPHIRLSASSIRWTRPLLREIRDAAIVKPRGGRRTRNG